MPGLVLCQEGANHSDEGTADTPTPNHIANKSAERLGLR